MIFSRGMRALFLFVLLASLGWAQAKAPNIVLIMADDLDQPAASQMALVRALITNQGLNFRRHYVSLSLCCPSRVSALKGQFAHNTGIYKNEAPDGGFESTFQLGLENSTVATWLQGAGYRTALFGKYLNGYPDAAPSTTYIPPGWTEWFSPSAGTPYKGFDYVMNENGTLVSYGATPSDYMTDVLARQAVSFISRSVSDHPTAPFFLYIAPYAPHSPATPAPRHEASFQGLKAPRTSSFNEVDVSDKPEWVRSTPRLTTAEIADIDKLYRKRRQSLLAVDDLVQSVHDVLLSTGQLSNTYLIFTSDNGYHQGQHRLQSGKNTAFEEDLLIPLMIRGPGVPVGRQVDHLTANVDYAPTFVELAGLAPLSSVDGRSLADLLRGQIPASWRQALLLEHKTSNSGDQKRADSVWEPRDGLSVLKDQPGIEGFSGLRLVDGTTYVEYDSGERELYNNLSDPAQLRNSYNSTPSSTKARLAAWLGVLKSASGAALRQAELAAP